MLPKSLKPPRICNPSAPPVVLQLCHPIASTPDIPRRRLPNQHDALCHPAGETARRHVASDGGRVNATWHQPSYPGAARGERDRLARGDGGERPRLRASPDGIKMAVPSRDLANCGHRCSAHLVLSCPDTGTQRGSLRPERDGAVTLRIWASASTGVASRCDEVEGCRQRVPHSQQKPPLRPQR